MNRIKITNRVQITSYMEGETFSGSPWRLGVAENCENSDDWLHSQDYSLSPAAIATLQSRGVIVDSQVVLIDATIDPVKE